MLRLLYQPSRREGSFSEKEKARYSQLPISGATQQAGEFYRQLDKVNREHLISNLASDLGQVKDPEIRTEMSAFFYQADPDYGTQVTQAVDVNLEEVKQHAAELQE